MPIRKKKKPNNLLGETTKEKIFEAAKLLFSERGYEGTSIGLIAKKAEINQSLIYHYFKDKLDLWKYVKNHILEGNTDFEQILQMRNMVHLPFSEFLSKIISARFKTFQNNPIILRMLCWQRLDPDQSILFAAHRVTLENWNYVIKVFQDRGEIRPDIPIEVILNLIWSSTTGLFTDFHPQFREGNEKLQLFYIEKTIECLLRALAP